MGKIFIMSEKELLAYDLLRGRKGDKASESCRDTGVSERQFRGGLRVKSYREHGLEELLSKKGGGRAIIE